jgi:hypothetical protein
LLVTPLTVGVHGPARHLVLAVSRWSVAQQTGYQASSGGFRGALSKLRTLDLITDEKVNGGRGIRASHELFDPSGQR